MRAIMETLFDIVYLTLVITVGFRMMTKGRKEKQFFLFGMMAVILGTGDAFHLLPRAYALCTTGLKNFTAALGIGKLVTSITMTVFYVLLYYVWRVRYSVQGGSGLSASILLLAVLRVVLCLFPQNEWTSADAPLSWGYTGIFRLYCLEPLSLSCFSKRRAKQTIGHFDLCGWRLC